MGNCCSSSAADKVGNSTSRPSQGAAEYTGGIISHTPSQISFDRAQSKHVQNPPPYEQSHTESDAFLSTYRELKAKGAPLASLPEWDVRIIVDERNRLSQATKDAIVVLCWTLLILFQACSANTTLCFMNYANPNMSTLSDKEQEGARLLNELYSCKTAREALDKLKGEQPQWIREKGLPGRAMKIMEDEKPQQRHPRLLAAIRDLKWDLAEPWETADMDFDTFLQVLKEAREADQAQPKVVSSLAFTIIREIQRQRKEYQDRTDDITSSVPKRKVIIITGTRLDQSESLPLKEELKLIEGGSSEFSIQVAHVDDDGVVDPILQELDNQRSGKMDIFDYTNVNARKLRTRVPGWALLAKTAFSEVRAFDKMVPKEDLMYGKHLHCSTNEKLVLPTAESVTAVLGLTQTSVGGW